MDLVYSFAPIETPAATVLILGSMPGVESLRAGQYYAHPRNAFWPIMGDLFGASPSLAYQARIARLQSAGIALWDVLAACARPGSLDADIDPASISPNDFKVFFSAHPAISRVFFNGAMAERYFQKQVRLRLELPLLNYQRLPSTSPAHAALSYSQKLAAWRVIAGVGQSSFLVDDSGC